jgi:hypothetical protein
VGSGRKETDAGAQQVKEIHNKDLYTDRICKENKQERMKATKKSVNAVRGAV